MFVYLTCSWACSRHGDAHRSFQFGADLDIYSYAQKESLWWMIHTLRDIREASGGRKRNRKGFRWEEISAEIIEEGSLSLGRSLGDSILARQDSIFKSSGRIQEHTEPLEDEPGALPVCLQCLGQEWRGSPPWAPEVLHVLAENAKNMRPWPLLTQTFKQLWFSLCLQCATLRADVRSFLSKEQACLCFLCMWWIPDFSVPLLQCNPLPVLTPQMGPCVTTWDMGHIGNMWGREDLATAFTIKTKDLYLWPWSLDSSASIHEMISS